jgi:hypothetical protein
MYKRIQNLVNLQYAISKGEPNAIEELKSLYLSALGKTMKRDCYSCRLRAYQELTNLTEQKINQMANQKHTFKDKDALVYFNHSHYTSANITDEVAEAMVKSNPANAELFHGTFEIEEKPKKKAAKEPVIEVPADTVIDSEEGK